MLSLRGLDNPAYYRVRPENPRHYIDYTGTGNTLNMREPYVLQLIMDSLRYWISEMHVDGFRFDLASALARELHEVDRLSAFFDIIQQDPVIRTVKLIAEPWDVGEGGYQVGNFPPHWAEWNGALPRHRARPVARRAGHAPRLRAPLHRLSADLYADEGRTPAASINFVTAHDGFTLADLVSYDRKHNHANGDGNRDGESHNRSWNCGVEGPTDDPGDPGAARPASGATCWPRCCSRQGVPMLLGGDELGRTQHGNNNGYCHDSELSWFDWDAGRRGDARLHAPAHRPAPRAPRSSGAGTGSRSACPTATPSEARDIEWCTPDGARMRDDDWHTDGAAAIAVYLSGAAPARPPGPAAHGRFLLPRAQRHRRATDLQPAGRVAGRRPGAASSTPPRSGPSRLGTRRGLAAAEPHSMTRWC